MFEHRLGYTFTRIRQKMIKNRNKRNELMCRYFRKRGVSIGKDCVILSDLDKFERELIFIGDGTTISSEVLFLTHDHSIWHLRHKYGDLKGKIIIGKNCFVGQRAILMYGISLADNIIVGAGSVVTHSFDQERIIICGNPAKIVGTWESFAEKYSNNFFESREDYFKALQEDDWRIIKRAVKK